MHCAIESIISTDLLDDKKKTAYDDKKFGAISSASTNNVRCQGGTGGYYKTDNNLRDSSGSRGHNQSKQSANYVQHDGARPGFSGGSPLGRNWIKSEMKAAELTYKNFRPSRSGAQNSASSIFPAGHWASEAIFTKLYHREAAPLISLIGNLDCIPK